MKNRIAEFRKRIESRDSYWVQLAKTYVGQDLEALFDRSGMTKSEWAAKIGKSSAYVSRLFSHDINFTIDSMVKLARSLNGKVEIRIVAAGESSQVSAPVSAQISPVATEPTWGNMKLEVKKSVGAIATMQNMPPCASNHDDNCFARAA